MKVKWCSKKNWGCFEFTFPFVTWHPEISSRYTSTIMYLAYHVVFVYWWISRCWLEQLWFRCFQMKLHFKILMCFHVKISTNQLKLQNSKPNLFFGTTILHFWDCDRFLWYMYGWNLWRLAAKITDIISV